MIRMVIWSRLWMEMTMQIVKETSRKVVGMHNYTGICDSCGTPIEYEDELIVIIVDESPEMDVVVCVDQIVCPACRHEIIRMKVYKNLEITEELSSLEK